MDLDEQIEYLDALTATAFKSSHVHAILASLRELKLARLALRDAQILMNESKGVAGWHLNGDIVSWDELRSGALKTLDAALKESPDGQ